MSLPSDRDARLARARRSLIGLSVGDAFGESMFGNQHGLVERQISRKRPWPWTDDTAMALSIVEALAAAGDIDPDDLAARFAARYQAEPARGYGGGAHQILGAIGNGMPWQAVAPGAFGGAGSMGNGAAMRAAPLGAYFADDLDAAVAAATRAAVPTHAHPDGVAGGVAIAVAAALATRIAAGELPADGLLPGVLARTPPGDTRDALLRAAAFPLTSDPLTVASAVGNGSRVISSDTVPYCLWSAARHLDDYAAALWSTASVWGDVDTTCAIVGGIVAMTTRSPIPAEWLAAREPLPGSHRGQ